MSLCLQNHVYGRLGESEQQCDLRYGQGVEDTLVDISELVEDAIHRAYHYSGWLIRVALVNGVVVREEYMKSGSKDGPLIKDYEVQAILEGEYAGGTWKDRPPTASLLDIQVRAKEGAMGKVWLRSDGALAMLRPGGVIVRLEVVGAADLDERIKREKEDQRKKSVPKF
jgi:hypothetical protein